MGDTTLAHVVDWMADVSDVVSRVIWPGTVHRIRGMPMWEVARTRGIYIRRPQQGEQGQLRCHRQVAKVEDWAAEVLEAEVHPQGEARPEYSPCLNRMRKPHTQW